MTTLRTILSLGLALAGVPWAKAAPVVEGAPRWTISGPGLDGLAPTSLQLATISAELPGVTGRRLAFSASGWIESLETSSDASLQARVFTFARDVFAYRLAHGGAVPIPVTVRANGATALPRLGVTGTSAVETSIDLERTATFTVSSGAPVVVLIASGTLSEADWSAAMNAAQSVADWDLWFADHLQAPSFPGSLEAGHSDRTVEALAVLHHALTTGTAGTLPLRAKGRLGTLGLEDAGLVARALAELGDEGAASAAKLQEQHLAHLTAMAEAGHMVAAGPFGDQDDASLRGLCLNQREIDASATDSMPSRDQ